jgi:nitrate reductase NapE
VPDARETERSRQRRELRIFLLLTVVVFPLLSVAMVACFALLVWLWQAFGGAPPG